MPCLAILACSLAVSCQAASKQPTSDEATVAAILKGGKFTLPKREQVARIMTAGRYYGMKIDLRYRADSQDVVITTFAGDTVSEMQTLANPLGGTRKLTDVRVWLWKEPDPAVTKAAQSRARRIIGQIYNEIAAISKSYPELALFDKDHVSVTDQSLSFQPSGEGLTKSRSKVNTPYISVGTREPQLGVGTQASFPSLLFPAQKLQLTWFVIIDDEALKNKIIAIVTNDAQPLIDAEKSMGGAPIRTSL
jgi:hypothetical protein